MTEDLNPYQPPQKSDAEIASDKRPTFLDWVVAIGTGIIAVVLTFFFTCFGIGTSFATSSFELLLPIGLFLCLLFSMGVGYSTVANHLAITRSSIDKNSAKMRSFRLERSNRKRSRFERFLFGSGIGLLTLILLVPVPPLLLEFSGATNHLSPDVSRIAEVGGLILALSVSILSGWRYWRRVSS